MSPWTHGYSCEKLSDDSMADMISGLSVNFAFENFFVDII